MLVGVFDFKVAFLAHIEIFTLLAVVFDVSNGKDPTYIAFVVMEGIIILLD
jgi:hypothetical protein